MGGRGVDSDGTHLGVGGRGAGLGVEVGNRMVGPAAAAASLAAECAKEVGALDAALVLSRCPSVVLCFSAC